MVVGNNAYLRAPQLDNAVNDAVAIAGELGSLGFQLIRTMDAKVTDINEAKRQFIKGISAGGIGVFYFSGHGVQVEGRNYVLPVEFSGTSVASLARQAISIPALLDEIEQAKPKLVIIILDTCRDNPFRGSTTSIPVTRGLAEVARRIPTGTLVLYSASSNQTALDSLPNQPSRHGLFTGELLSAMRRPGLEIRDLAQSVRQSVMEKAQSAGHVQIPALYENLSVGSFYFSELRSRPTLETTSSSLPAQIKLIVPFAAQSPSDALVRTMASHLGKSLGRNIVIDNQVDVRGDRVTELAAASAKDGSVLLVSSFAAAARRFGVRDMRLAPLGIFSDTPLSLIVNNSINASNLSQLFEATRAGKRLRMTVPLGGSPEELCALQFKKKFGSDLVELISVNGSARAFQSVIEGSADITCSSTAIVRRMAASPGSGIREIAEVRWTASAIARKSPVEPAGPQGFDILAPNWLGLFAPAGTDPNVMRELSAAIAKLQADANFAQAIGQAYAYPVSAEQSTPEGLVQALRLAVSLLK